MGWFCLTSFIVDQRDRFANVRVFRDVNRVAHTPILLLPSCQTPREAVVGSRPTKQGESRHFHE